MNIELSAEEIQMVQAALSNHKDKLWSQIHELQHPFKGYDVRLHEKWRAKADEAIALSKRIGSDFAAPSSQAVSVPDGIAKLANERQPSPHTSHSVSLDVVGGLGCKASVEGRGWGMGDYEKPGVTDANACRECGGTGEVTDWSSVGCGDPSCCSPGMMWCRHCNETGIEPEPPQ